MSDATLLHQARLTETVVRENLRGISHEESLAQPRPAGNCLNWVLGHLLAIYNNVLPLVGQQPVLPSDALMAYARGSAPLTAPENATPLAELQAAWTEACARMDAGLAGLSPTALAAPAPFSPGGDSNETVGSLLGTVLFHQSYHAGQLGLLRRLAGKPGAIA